MPGLKINVEAVERDCNTNAEGFCADGGVRVGSLLVSPGGVRDSEGHYYELSLKDFDVVPAAEGGFLGRGSSGAVHRAIHRSSNTTVALKEIKVCGKAHMSEVRRELETLHAGHCATPYLVNFYGAFTHEGSVFIAMEAMDGSLQEIAKPVPLPVLACITRQMLKGLFYLHRVRHLMHRDLKPSNVLYSSRTGDIKISDFGVSSFLECTKADAHSFVGTVTYMSPERLHGDSYSYGADIWSLGLVVAELALGVCPFAGLRGESSEGRFWALIQHLSGAGPALELPSDMDRTLAEFIGACVVKVPDQRATCSDLLQHPFIRKYTASSVSPALQQAAVGAAKGGAFLAPPLHAAVTTGTSRSPVLSFPLTTRSFEGFPVAENGGPCAGAGSSPVPLQTSPALSSPQERHEGESAEDFADHLVIQKWIRSMEERAARPRHKRHSDSARRHKSHASLTGESTAGSKGEGSAADTISATADGEPTNSTADEGRANGHGSHSGDRGSASLSYDDSQMQCPSIDSQLSGEEPPVNLDEELNKLLL
ncbi:putative protein kinase [Leptomonas seymouri]|uniref:mitogen-activated protein kinase kinase n=1 Tax=Leptomonas seymouri TaxID=5684 RepID=A0A0N1I0B6_LEPSE|nr:putative protein kinase [Leptomonas seymouri]|eukprot:KPI89223.1 putative protein kinase [Leptomonas seymouri]